MDKTRVLQSYNLNHIYCLCVHVTGFHLWPSVKAEQGAIVIVVSAVVVVGCQDWWIPGSSSSTSTYVHEGGDHYCAHKCAILSKQFHKIRGSQFQIYAYIRNHNFTNMSCSFCLAFGCSSSFFSSGLDTSWCINSWAWTTNLSCDAVKSKDESSKNWRVWSFQEAPEVTKDDNDLEAVPHETILCDPFEGNCQA